jgi:uncharacterized membrane protein
VHFFIGGVWKEASASYLAPECFVNEIVARRAGHLTARSFIWVNKNMPNPLEPPSAAPPSAAAPEPAPASAHSSTGLPGNVAAALACFPLVGGIIFYVLEKRDRFVRFYALQSIIFGAAWFLFNMISWVVFHILESIPVLGRALVVVWGLAVAFVHLAFLVVMIIAIVKAFSGIRWDIPYIGPVARKQVDDL